MGKLADVIELQNQIHNINDLLSKYQGDNDKLQNQNSNL